MSATKADRRLAAEWLVARRGEGVPAIVTADEAYRLSGGVTGTAGDHSTPVSLAAVALAVAVAA